MANMAVMCVSWGKVARRLHLHAAVSCQWQGDHRAFITAFCASIDQLGLALPTGWRFQD